MMYLCDDAHCAFASHHRARPDYFAAKVGLGDGVGRGACWLYAERQSIMRGLLAEYESMKKPAGKKKYGPEPKKRSARQSVHFALTAQNLPAL